MRTRRAFTLVEILIVVVILGVLAGVVVPAYTRSTDEASRTATYKQLLKVRQAIDMYYVRGRPQALPQIGEGNGEWGELLIGGDYLRDVPRNQWVQEPARRIIIHRDTPDTQYHSDYGWIYNPATGELWAAAFDAEDKPFPKQ